MGEIPEEFERTRRNPKDLKKLEGAQRQAKARKQKVNTISGGNGKRDPPVPIPNTAVKPLRADGTWLETARESRSSPEPLSPALGISPSAGFFYFGRPYGSTMIDAGDHPILAGCDGLQLLENTAESDVIVIADQHADFVDIPARVQQQLLGLGNA